MRIIGSVNRLDTFPTEAGGASASFPEDAVVCLDFPVVAMATSTVSWVAGTPRC